MKIAGILILLVCACASAARVHADAAKMGMAWIAEGQAPTAYSTRCFWQAWGFAALSIALAGFAGWLAGQP